MKVNIQSVIKERLKLQSTQKALEADFALSNLSVEKILSSSMQQNLQGWDERKRKRFVQLVGGRAYVKETQEYLGI